MSALPVPTTVLVVAPPTLQRQGLLATLLEARRDLAITTTAEVSTLTQRLCRDAPTLLILDAALPGIQNGLIEQIRALCPAVRMLILGGKRLPFAVARFVVEHGGGALLNRHATPGELIAAVEQLIGNPPPDRFEASEPRRAYGSGIPQAAVFSTRELEVLQLVAADHTTQEIAARLCISVRTVDAHRRMLLEKTGARSMIGLVLSAVRSGWVSMA